VIRVRVLPLRPDGFGSGQRENAYKLDWLSCCGLSEAQASRPQALSWWRFQHRPGDRDIHDPGLWGGIMASDRAQALRAHNSDRLHACLRRFEPTESIGLVDYPQPPGPRRLADPITSTHRRSIACATGCAIDKWSAGNTHPADHARWCVNLQWPEEDIDDTNQVDQPRSTAAVL